MSLSKVIETARADLGYTENPPGSNMTKYGEAYGMNGVPWCVAALWFWFNEASPVLVLSEDRAVLDASLSTTKER